jgi:hypothetical protein
MGFLRETVTDNYHLHLSPCSSRLRDASRRSCTRAICAALVALFAAPAVSSGQTGGGLGEEARLLPSGKWRFQFNGDWITFDQRFGSGLDGSSASTLTPFGSLFGTPVFGAASFPQIATVQSDVRLLTGIETFTGSLGEVNLKTNARLAERRLSIERGFPGFQLGVTVPLVTATVNISPEVNRTPGSATLGINPALGGGPAGDANAALVAQFGQAATNLAAKIAACEGSTASDCAAINADRPAALAVASNAGLFASLLERIYSANFVPLAGSTAQQAVATRIAALAGQLGGYGFGFAPAAGAVGATTVIGPADFARLVTVDTFGIVARPIASRSIRNIGDVEVMLRIPLTPGTSIPRDTGIANRIPFRMTVGGGVRLPTGTRPPENTLVGLGTGDGQLDVIGQANIDLTFSRRFWTSFSGTYTDQRPHTEVMRIPSALSAGALSPANQSTNVTRDLGNIIRVEVTPRIQLSRFTVLGAQYVFAQKSADRYTGSVAVPIGEGSIDLDASILDEQIAAQEHRVGVGIAFSNLATGDFAHSWLPIDASVMHYQTIAGRGLSQPKFFGDRLVVRWYPGFFGGRTIKKPIPPTPPRRSSGKTR